MERVFQKSSKPNYYTIKQTARTFEVGKYCCSRGRPGYWNNEENSWETLGVCKRFLCMFRWPREAIQPDTSRKALGSASGVRSRRPPVTDRQVFAFLLRPLCPCWRS